MTPQVMTPEGLRAHATNLLFQVSELGNFGRPDEDQVKEMEEYFLSAGKVVLIDENHEN